MKKWPKKIKIKKKIWKIFWHRKSEQKNIFDGKYPDKKLNCRFVPLEFAVLMKLQSPPAGLPLRCPPKPRGVLSHVWLYSPCGNAGSSTNCASLNFSTFHPQLWSREIGLWKYKKKKKMFTTLTIFFVCFLTHCNKMSLYFGFLCATIKSYHHFLITEDEGND